MLPEAALQVVGVVVAFTTAIWAGLLALAEEAAVGEALHTLGDAPPPAAESRVPLHRALHVARLALLVLGGVAAANAIAWWTRPWAGALLALVVSTLLLFVVGDALPPGSHRSCPTLHYRWPAARSRRSGRCSGCWHGRIARCIPWSRRRVRSSRRWASRSATCCSACSRWPTPLSTKS